MKSTKAFRFGFALWAAAALAAAPVVAAEAPGAAVVTRAEGVGAVLRDGGPVSVASNDALKAGEQIKTGPDATLDLAVNKLAGVRVLPSSEVTLESVIPEDMRVKVDSGNVILNLSKLPPGTAFRVETPTAVASVRGTQFWGRVDTAAANNPVTTFAVREGSVEVLAKAAGRSFTLEQGQALDIPKTGGTPEVRAALEGELDAMRQADSIKTAA